jgi:MGT family glycosyltransferase
MARIWFYNIPYHGHVNPTLPLVRELVTRGDDVTYFAGPAFAERIAATGAHYCGYGNAEAFDQSREDNHLIHQGALVAESTHLLLGEVLAAVEDAHPDVIMFDMSAPWGSVAGRRFGIPAIASYPHLPFYWRTVVDDPRVFRKAVTAVRPGLGHWGALRRQTTKIVTDYRLRKPADINVLSSSAELNIAFLTRYFQPYAERFDSSYVYVGPTIDIHRPETPMVIEQQPGQQLIYIAVGTLYKANVAFFQACMAAFADSGYAVIMSIGKAVDPADLGEIPSNFTVAQYVPQLQILQAADVFVTHGGMNSINEAVTFDVPMVVVPNTVEQSINAARIEELQCGLYLDPAQLTVETLRASVAKVLSDPAISRGLPRLRRSFEEAGGPPMAADAIDGFKARHGVS